MIPLLQRHFWERTPPFIKGGILVGLSVCQGKCWWIAKRHPKASDKVITRMQKAIPR